MPRPIAIKYCRHCGRIVPLESTACPYCGRITLRAHEHKECPFCGEPVKVKALKCKHCGEFIDGRQSPRPEGQQVLHIEKAIIATARPRGDAELFRPDGEPLTGPALPGGRQQGELPPGQEHALPAAAQPPGELPAAPAPARAAEVTAPAPAAPLAARVSGALFRAALASGRTAAKAAAALLRRACSATPSAQAAAPPGQPFAPAAPVELECPVCGRPVFVGDHYCENCGRDLTLPRGKPGLRPIGRHYALADVAFILSAAAPLGLLLSFPYSVLLPAAGAALALLCAWRVLRSGGRLLGLKAALGALVIGVFWLVLIIAARPA